MKISHLIQALEAIKKEHGDLIVEVPDWDGSDFGGIREMDTTDLELYENESVKTLGICTP